MAANTFIELNDTPSDFAGGSGKYLRVRTDETGIIYSDVALSALSEIEIDSPPTYTFVGDGRQLLMWKPEAGNNNGRWVNENIFNVFNVLNGNGLSQSSPNSSSVQLDVVATSTGGLGSNSQGIYIADIANVAGNYGSNSSVPTFTVNSKGQITDVTEVGITDLLNFQYVSGVNGTSGQINVADDGNSNLTLSLASTAVTPATYGNATHIPSITVDTYGRITLVDEIDAFGNIQLGDANANISLGDITTQAFSSVRVDDDGVISTFQADGPSDVLNIQAGAGINMSGNAQTDTLTISTDISGLTSMSVSIFRDVDTTGVVDGQSLIYDSANSVFVPGSPATFPDLNQSNIGELSDVSISGISNGDLLQWNAANAAFQNIAINVLDSNANLVYTGIDVDYEPPAGDGFLAYEGNGQFRFTPADVPQDISDLADSGNLIPTSITDLGISDGSAGQVLTTDGNGSFTFDSITGSTPSTTERFKLNYAANGDLVGIDNQSSGIANVVIESATGGGVKITFDDSLYNFPPTSVMFYGYDYTNNKYWVVPLDTSVALRELSAGGTPGLPTLFDGSGTVELRLQMREADTGASRGNFGTTTHAWAQFVL